MPCRSHRTFVRTCPTCKRLSRESYNRRYSGSYVVYSESTDYSAGSGSNDGGSGSDYSSNDGGGGASTDFGGSSSTDFGGSSSSYDSGSSSSYDSGGSSSSTDF